MNGIKYMVAVAFSAALVACGGGSGAAGGQPGDLQQARSRICAEVTGGGAIIWDLYNGALRTDSVLPPAPPAGPRYGHPTVPLLGFFYPTGWTASTTQTDIGVDVVRDDRQAVWREITQPFFGPVTAVGRIDAEVQLVLGFLGQQGAQVETLCTNQGAGPVGGGVISDNASIMFRVGNHTAIILINLLNVSGTGNVRTKIVLAPTAEFGARSIDTFLAIDWQMSFGTDENFFDSDGDGWRDGVDIDKNDPNEPTPGGLPFG